MNQILVVDDEVGIRELLSEILQDEGYEVRLAENAGQARDMRSKSKPDLVLLDIWMPDTDGITLLREWAGNGLLTMPVVVMSGHGTIETAVEATRIGAFDFLEKPIALQKLLATVGRALQRGAPQIKPTLSLDSLGKAPLMLDFKQRLEQLSHVKPPVLFSAEPGSGAELCARFLHRPNSAWVAPDNLSCLGEKPLDLLNQARDGTFFIEEVENLSKLEQKGLLQQLDKLEKFNVRLICSTSRNLAALVADGVFDVKLFQGISALTLKIPSLREHKEDIPELANLILGRCIEANQNPVRQFNIAALNALRHYDWPGNLAQLEATVNTLANTSLEEEISHAEVNRVLSQFDVEREPHSEPLPPHLSLREARDKFERTYLEYHISKEQGNMSRVAERSGLERTHLYRKLKQLGIKISKKD